MADEKGRVTKPAPRHHVNMANRQYVEVTGVLQVESFDSEQFVLQTPYGFLAIRGENLHIKTLNLEDGIVIIEGVVFEMGYDDDGPGPAERARGWLTKLFR
ncbi:sporulation protein YabP [Kyrpidia spormannii]|uniref:Spore protein involved in the shaping of the spore coat n=2 Tax=Kyrpidia spormannii TaxID=2055160 RepID=A0ACA8Z4K7_9BACL|nr:sporulation protein YabP [Kyrpidia spormannii]CAB3389261.1 spore protein involved in the shaping of the spore coat [Kyrpidia spormannii]CAB3389784.1 spore protein involved in the shaping of the spore coat [Kyrpidia spormannii]